MVSNDQMRKFLNGDVSDDEFRHCEMLLASADTPPGELEAAENDPLVDALKAAKALAVDEHSDTEKLLARIERTTAQQSIAHDDLQRLLDPPQQPDELGRIGKYRIIEFIAAGGMGLVFKAEDSELDRMVCIKIMHPALAMKADAKLRFQRESHAAARLRSDRIVTLLDMGTQRDLPFIVMQLLEGESLRSQLNRDCKLPVELAIHYTRQVAEGLRHAHALGILHRDIKPDNIWITREGNIKLLDFGLARPLDESASLTTSGGFMGTPQYMSPEQIHGEHLDVRSDMFSLGIVLYEMLTGTLPFQKTNLFSTMIAITNDSVDLSLSEFTPELLPGLDSVLRGLLQKDPAERTASAQELIDQLEDLNRPTATATTASALPRRAASPTRRRRWPFNHNPWILLAFLGGLCTTSLAIVLYKETDKGTLVVRAHDPQAEVQVSKEKVTIKDPLTDRSFEVTVGENVLRSGVYQLEMNDPASGLTFSSNSIVIRRGEVAIVEVELVPKPSTIPSEVESKKSPANASVLADKASETSDRNADLSANAQAREDFSERLEQLTALTLDQLSAAAKTGSYLLDEGKLASVPQKKLTDIESWSIELESNAWASIQPNCDHTLFAAPRGTSVQVWDKNCKLKYTLQSTKLVTRTNFDNKFPNLIAVASISAKLDGSYDSSEPLYELSIWRLGPDYAEMIYQFPIWQIEFSWDQGFRLLYRSDEGISAFRLDQAKHYPVHGPEGRIPFGAVSPNGRYLATQNKGNLDVWDLKNGAFAFTALNSRQVEWNRQSDRAAFFASARPAIEIWDLDKRSIDDKVELPSPPAGSDRSRMTTNAIGLEPTFQRVAWLAPSGDLTVRNLHTNREGSLRLPGAAETTIRNASIYWEGGAFVVETNHSANKWTHRNSDVEGELKEQGLSPVFAMRRGQRLQLTNAVGKEVLALSWTDEDAQMRNRPNATAHRENEMFVDLFDVRANKFQHDLPIGFKREATYKRGSLIGFILGPPYISPNGKYIIAPSDMNVPRGTQRQPSLYAFGRKDSVVDVNSGSPYTLWDKSSRFAALVDVGTRSPKSLTVYDATEARVIDKQTLALPEEEVIDLHPRDYGFLACVRTEAPTASTRSPAAGPPPSKYRGNLQIWIIDGTTQQAHEAVAVSYVLKKLTSIESITSVERYVFVSCRGPNIEPNKPSTTKRIYRIPIDGGQDAKVECVTIPAVDGLVFSPSGEFVVRQVRDGEETYTDTPFGRNVMVSNGNGSESLLAARWSDVALDLGSVDELDLQSADAADWSKLSSFPPEPVAPVFGSVTNLQFHPTADVATWTNRDLEYFFDAESKEVRAHTMTMMRSVGPTQDGWNSVHYNEIHFFDLRGQAVGRLVFDHVLSDAARPSNPRWIFPDGSLWSQSTPTGLAISFLKDNRLYSQTVEEFEKTHAGLQVPRSDRLPSLEARSMVR